MPNQNYFEAREELKMAQCDLALSYPTCKTEERLCKFAYASWCPTCDKESPRRRSKSETNEPCRKKGREMKGAPKKYDDWNQECENMELEYETKDVRCHDTFRIRSNLCELPTTYITNNCQMMKLSSCPSDFVDNSEKGIKCYENNVKSNDFNSQFQNFGNMSERQDKISKFYPRIEEAARNINGIVNKINPKLENIKPHININSSSAQSYLDSKKSPKNVKSPLRNHDGKKSKPINGIVVNHNIESLHNNRPFSPKTNELLYNVDYNTKTYDNCSPYNHPKFNQGDIKLDNNMYVKPSSQPNYTRSPQTNTRHNIVDIRFYDANDSHNADYDTRTFFDKRIDVANLKERYAREVELLKEKLKGLKNSPYDKSHSAPVKRDIFCKLPHLGATENVKMDFKRMRQAQTNGAIPKVLTIPPNEPELPLPPVQNKRDRLKSTSKVSLKTKGKLGTAKLRKQRSKPSSNVTSSSDMSNSNCSGSEDSDKEDDNLDETESLDDVSTASSIRDIPFTGSTKHNFELYDAASWPIRQSLFPHIPPYLCFIVHDASKPQKLPLGARYLKWKLSTITPILVRKTLTNSGFRLVRKSNEWMGTWGKHMKSPMFKTLKETQKLNHFPGTFQIGRKDRLWRNLQRLILRYGQKEFGFIPQTYVLPQDLKLLKQHWQNKNGTGDEKYIIKPPASARGTGIKVINRWAQLPKRMSLVVQEYISNPYLINGSKFDLRLYVLVTSFNPLRIYLYPEGLARFASVPYNDDANYLKDRYMHLTNYSINKMSTMYTANEDANACKGHKWTISKLWEYMTKRGVDTKKLWMDLQQLVIKTLISGEATIVPLCRDNMNSRYNCYELFGIDVLLDEHLKSWLLEVNISPSLHSQSPLDEHVKGPLVKSLFELAQFHLPPRLGKIDRATPSCYDPRIYATTLTKKERNKQNFFSQTETREDYLEEILVDLTGDDVRHLTQAEDELVVIGKFEKIFPTAQTHKYLNFLDVRYYNRLFDAWECKYESNRQPGIEILQSLCDQKMHLKVAPPPVIDKSLPNMIPGEQNLQPLKDGQIQSEVLQSPMLPLPELPLLVNTIPYFNSGDKGNIPTSYKPAVNYMTLYDALHLESEKGNMVLRTFPDYSTQV